MQGSAILSTGRVLGLNLSQSISSVLTTWSNWKDPASGVWTALVLFLLMAGAQTVAMLLPQWIAKAKKKKIAKLGRNPAQKESDNKMKWFTYIMLAMIIFMGFSLVSALGVYWLVGALFSIAQTLITHAIMNRKGSKK
jgi:membrane protein insertase Oxa1/YidC/SpoIIIJ